MNRITAPRPAVKLFTIVLIVLAAANATVRESRGQNLAPNAPRDDTNTVFFPMVVTTDSGQPPEPDTIIPETTKVLTDESNDYLEEISGGGTFTFSQITPELAQLETGDVIVSDVSDVAPYGYLRRVEDIQTDDDKMLIQTSAATLEDAIERGRVSISEEELRSFTIRQLSVSDPHTAWLNDDQEASFYCNIYHKIAESVLLHGGVTMEVGYEFDFEIKNSRLTSLRYETIVSETADLTLAAYQEATFSREFLVEEIDMGTRVVYVGFVPVVLNLGLNVYVGADGVARAEVTTSMNQTFKASAGAQYAGGQWAPVSSLKNEFDYEPPEITHKAEVNAYARGEVELSLYGALSLSAGVKPGLKLTSEDVLCWQLFGVLEAGVGAKLTLFSGLIPDYEKQLLDYEELITELDNCNAPACELYYSRVSAAATLNYSYLTPCDNDPTQYCGGAPNHLHEEQQTSPASVSFSVETTNYSASSSANAEITTTIEGASLTVEGSAQALTVAEGSLRGNGIYSSERLQTGASFSLNGSVSANVMSTVTISEELRSWDGPVQTLERTVILEPGWGAGLELTLIQGLTDQYAPGIPPGLYPLPANNKYAFASFTITCEPLE